MNALVSTWKEFLSLGKILQLKPNLYILLSGLDKETLTNVFLGEALADLSHAFVMPFFPFNDAY